MSIKSPIEWTESHCFEQPLETFFQFRQNNNILCYEPLEYIFIFFRRIARRAGRNNIFGFGTTTFGNWNYMVKCCGWRIAVSTIFFKLCHNLKLNFRFDWLTLAFATMSVLSSFKPVFLICEIPNSCVFSLMKFAKSIFRYRFGFKPLLTFSAPSQTFLKHQSSFTNSNIISLWFVITIAALTFQTIKTRTVFGEKFFRLPLLTSSAFFQACFNPLQILDNGNSSFFCRTFNSTFFSLSHIFVYLSPLNFNIKRRFL